MQMFSFCTCSLHVQHASSVPSSSDGTLHSLAFSIASLTLKHVSCWAITSTSNNINIKGMLSVGVVINRKVLIKPTWKSHIIVPTFWLGYSSLQVHQAMPWWRLEYSSQNVGTIMWLFSWWRLEYPSRNIGIIMWLFSCWFYENLSININITLNITLDVM